VEGKKKERGGLKRPEGGGSSAFKNQGREKKESNKGKIGLTDEKGMFWRGNGLDSSHEGKKMKSRNHAALQENSGTWRSYFFFGPMMGKKKNPRSGVKFP